MIRSLSVKLVLALVLTSLVGIIVAALLLRTLLTRGFDDYVIERQRTAFIELVSAHYEATGSWEGVGRVFQATRRRGGPPGGQLPGSPGGGPPGGPPVYLVLIDTSGRIVLSGGPLPSNFRVGAAELAAGVPVVVDDQRVGTVITLSRPSERNEAEAIFLTRTDGILSLAAALSAGLALVLGVVLARLITRPVRELTTAAGRIASGDLSHQVPVRSRDELGLLAAQFNQMTSDLARATTLRRQLTADIAHDLRTPLTVIAGYLEAVKEGVLTPTPERLGSLHDETQLLLSLVEDLHTLSLADAGELPLNRQAVAPATLLTRVAETYQHAAEQQRVALAVQTPPALPAIQVDLERMVRVLGNLVSNALRHTPDGGLVTLAAQPVGSGLTISVSDTGSGIAPEHLSSIFERFYRADPSRTQATGGSGLGLAIVKSLVEAHGGTVAVTSTPGQGTTFTIDLPTALSGSTASGLPATA